jgi:phage tail-like protein
MAREVDPLISFQFALDINGMTGYFTEVSGINSTSEVATHKVVNDEGREVVLQVPGRSDGSEFTLKRGLTKNSEFWDWREKVVTGQVDEARRWNFVNGWPSKITGPQIAADSNDFTIEEITIVHEGMYIDAPGIGLPNMAPD